MIQKSFNERLAEWRKNHPITQEEADEIYRQRDLARASEFLADCDHKSVDKNGEW